MANPEIVEQEILERTRARLLEVDATVTALMRLVCDRCRKDNETEAQLWDALIQEKNKRHEELLIALENKQPATAASLDKRPLHGI